MTLAEHLKQNGITLTAFAASIGEKVTTVHGWMSGRRNPGLASLVAIERTTNGAVRAIDFLPVDPPPSASDPPRPGPKRSARTTPISEATPAPNKEEAA
jgi:transcriptional regulator with XRE-family HTH domain